MFMQVSMGPGRMRDGKSCSRIPKFKDPSKLTEELTKEEIAEKVADMARLSAFAKKCGYDTGRSGTENEHHPYNDLSLRKRKKKDRPGYINGVLSDIQCVSGLYSRLH